MIRRLGVVLACGAVLAGAGCSGDGDGPRDRTVELGFYAYFEPVSRSADPEPGTAGFDTQVGYEADLLNAVEAMDGVGLSFRRQGVGSWEGIWLRPATEDLDLASGGITILESRTMDAAGNTVVAFTDGHIDFRQSLLVRAADAARLPDHASLGAADIVGALPNTTGEARLLQLIGVADAAGGLARGTRVETPGGVVVVPADGALSITAAGASPELAHRVRLIPADPDGPQVLYMGDADGAPLGEAALLAALREGRVDAVARGAVGNAQIAAASQGELAVTAYDDRVESGGFAVAADDTDLLDRMNVAVSWLTDGGRIGFTDWLADPGVFMSRAAQWQPPQAS